MSEPDYAAFDAWLRGEKQAEPEPEPRLRPVNDGNISTGPWAARALSDEITAVVTAANGSRNDRLNQAAFNLSQIVAGGALNEQEVIDALTRAALGAGLEAVETSKTIASGMKAGRQHPRRPPARQERPTWPTSPQVDPLTSASVTGTTGPADTAAGAEPGGADEQGPTAYELLVREEALRQRVRREARKQIDAEEAAKDFRVPPWRPTLTAELQIPDEPVRYTVDKVLPVGGNVLLAAQFKTGKTTFVNNLALSLADSEPFLGNFDTAPLAGRVALWNYEVDDRQMRRWLRDMGIGNTDAVTVLNLRGYRMPLINKHVEDWIVHWLEQHETAVWVVDPFARAFVGSGKSENDNTEVGAFLDALDVIKSRAGVSDLILPTHTGRAEFEEGQERARGATRLDDWADVRWMLTKDENDVRYFSATGRDVEVDEESVTFDPLSRRLLFGGGDRRWTRNKRLEDAVVAAVTAEPGITQSKLRATVRRALGKAENTAVDDAAEAAEAAHRIRIDRPERNGQAVRHYLNGKSW